MAEFATPNSLGTLKEWILRELGAPVIKINISDQQITDRISDALSMWQRYHYDGQKRDLIAHLMTQQEIDQKYILLDPSIDTVLRVVKPSSTAFSHSNDLFNIDYQLRLNDLWDLTNVNLSGYVIMRQYLGLIDDILNTAPPVRYNIYEGKLFIDINYSRFLAGAYIIIEVYKKMSPADFPGIWGDSIFRKLSSAYCKKQWGDNLKKYGGVSLPGGVTLNGQQIYDDAMTEIATLEKDFILNYNIPPSFFMG